LLLLLVHPAGKGDEQQAERIQALWHLCSLSFSLHRALGMLRRPLLSIRSGFLDVTGGRASPRPS
jgi:hypothetical protein